MKDLLEFPVKNTTGFIPGAVGKLELSINLANNDIRKNYLAIICHPDPQQEGTMDNKVVYMTAKAFNELGVDTIRFNYRGVGNSAGSYGAITGEIEDLQTVINWAKKYLPNRGLILAGFSFGAFISAKVASQLDCVKYLLSIAPTVNIRPYHSLEPVSCPWYIIAATNDEIVPFGEVFDYVNKLDCDVEFYQMQHASHFFHGRLTDLKTVIKDYYNFRLE